MMTILGWNFQFCMLCIFWLFKSNPDKNFSQQNNSVFFGLFFQKTIHCVIEVVASEAAAILRRRTYSGLRRRRRGSLRGWKLVAAASSAEPKALVWVASKVLLTVPKCLKVKAEMLSLIKSKTKKQDGSRAGNGKLGKRSRSLISRPIEVLTSANLNKLQQQQKQQKQQQQNLQLYEQQQQLQVKTCQNVLIYSSINPKYNITLYDKFTLLTFGVTLILHGIVLNFCELGVSRW